MPGDLEARFRQVAPVAGGGIAFNPMALGKVDYDGVYRSRTWAYGDKPDEHLIRALSDVPRGPALDVGGGQGRHALALSALGFDVLLMDTAAEGLHQASAVAEERGLRLQILQADARDYEPAGMMGVIVAALFFHGPPRKRALELAGRLGSWLGRKGLMYFSLPGYSRQSEEFVAEIAGAAGCELAWVEKHLVTKKERPRLNVPRRNETRALAHR